MAITVCFAANTLYYNKGGGGHMWWHLNWALGFKANSCRVLWFEKVVIDDKQPAEKLIEYVRILKSRLADFGLTDGLVLYSSTGQILPDEVIEECLSLEEAFNADIFFNLRYDLPSELVIQFKKSAFLDLDPGILQKFMANGTMNIALHDFYFTIGETVGQPYAKFPTGNVTWNYMPPSVSLDWWKPQAVEDSAPFTTVSHWNAGEWVVDEDGTYYSNDKKDGFLPYLDLPQRTTHNLELALCLNGDSKERDELNQKGWYIKESWEVSETPVSYQKYILASKGEFSCAKPHYVKLETAWISDRTICYLASGKPAIVQHTGTSRFLPDNAGLFRFKNMADAIQCFEQVAKDYDRHSAFARSLADEYFNATKNTARLLSMLL